MVLGNTYFRKNEMNNFIRQRIDNVRAVERAMMDYVIVEKSSLGRLVDVHLPREAGGMVSNHFLVVA